MGWWHAQIFRNTEKITMKYSDGVITKSKMDTKTTYIFCPDPKCKLFWDTGKHFPCEWDCPLVEDMQKVIKCIGCGELTILPGDHHYFCRVDHRCPNGNTASNFQRMSGQYQLIYKIPG